MVDSKENYKFDQGIKGLTLKIWLLINYKNLVLDQDNNFYLISLSILSLLAKWCMYGYDREKLHVNQFWELNPFTPWVTKTEFSLYNINKISTR